MGIEYRISCPPEGLSKLADFLRSEGGLPSAKFPEQIEFRFRSSSHGEMPDATVVIETQGLYFCDHCGAREPVSILFRRIIDKALALSGSSDGIAVMAL